MDLRVQERRDHERHRRHARERRGHGLLTRASHALAPLDRDEIV
jgi:hypothetical protein